jgi:mRNA-degrading endonuclease RelE of RelBE toxin-antitoxin system
MPRYFIDVPKSAKKSLAKIPLAWAFRIKQAIDRLVNEPYLGEKMLGKYADKRKIAVRPYRVIYTIHEDLKLIRIKEIEHRGNTSYD